MGGSQLSSGTLATGEVREGWLTFVVPESGVDALTLANRMHGGSGSTLLVPLGPPAASPTVGLKKPIVLDGEQVRTVTVYVRVKALRATTVGSTYYSVRTKAGRSTGGVRPAHTRPLLQEGARSRRSSEGWVTLMAPTTQLKSLTLIYHLRGGDGSTLLVPLHPLG